MTQVPTEEKQVNCCISIRFPIFVLHHVRLNWQLFKLAIIFLPVYLEIEQIEIAN